MQEHGQEQGRAEPTLAKAYDPRQVEDDIYAFWLKGGWFVAPRREGEQPFVIVIPPPNVTGALHMGHALDNTMQDVLIRFHRMRGVPTLWLPGTDHAGLATQIKVEEVLREQEGRSRHDLGREAFIERVWQWKDHYERRILGQLHKLGASCDWSRTRFTMDEGCSKAVLETFVRLYEKGLIYRGDYMINWCPHCRTALSDIEVEHAETQGKLWHFSYPLADGSGQITVATTRPETMLGDTAVAVNPADERYAHLVGRMLRHPFTGRLLPIIADDYVDPAFGSGAVKMTPFHDPNDFEIGRRHNLDFVQVIGWDGRMTAAATERFAGQDRYECRRAVVEALGELSLMAEIEEHALSLGHCQRCETVVEPLVSTQWFVRMQPLAEPAVRAVQDGAVKIWPDRFNKVYINWMENIRDWCISRQIWWGHRIPAWYCPDEHITVAREAPRCCSTCGSADLRQDDDCLDTWFSSALWPFSTLGWPDDTEDLRYFYPTSVLVTGYDILFFWVARMIFSGLEFTGRQPFDHVLLHGLVRDAEGRKMSKSLGNGIDPLDVIDQYGADTLRFTLTTGNAPGNDMRFQFERVEASRNFCNKLWNAARFVLMNLEGFDPAEAPSLTSLALEDRWILSRLARTVDQVTRCLSGFELGEAARALYDFIWSEYCDWYIELVKPRLYGRQGAATRQVAQYVLWQVLDQTLRLLHPLMPFITETIWQKLPHVAGEAPALLVARWPAAAEQADAEAEEEMALVTEVIKAIRNIRAEMNVPAGKKAAAVLMATGPRPEAVLEANREHIIGLALVSDLQIGPVQTGKPEQSAAAMTPGVEIYVPMADLIDIPKEIARLQKDAAAVRSDLERVDKKLGNAEFLAKAPPAVVAKEREKQAGLSEKLQGLEARLRILAEL